MDPRPNPFQRVESQAAQTWSTTKTKGRGKKAIDTLMEYEGLEEIKSHFIEIKQSIDLAKIQGRKPKNDNYNVAFEGNPGTGKNPFTCMIPHILAVCNTNKGKTSVARLYQRLLRSLGIVPRTDIVETSGVELATDGLLGMRGDVRFLLKYKDAGGVLFIDESYQMLSDHQGRQVLDMVMKSMSDKKGKLVVIFAGYKKQMEPFFEYNQGLSSRVRRRFHFPNFTKAGLWEVLIKHVREEYAEMRFEDGDDGIYVQIAIQRLERGSHSASFGNARAVQACVSQMVQRQLLRLSRQELTMKEEGERHGDTEQGRSQRGCIIEDIGMSESRDSHESVRFTDSTMMFPEESSLLRSGKSSTTPASKDPSTCGDSSDGFSDDGSSMNQSPETKERYCLLTRDDIIGPPPGNVFDSQAWRQLQSLVGLEEVKRAVQTLIESLDFNYRRECEGKPVMQFPLNRVFVGQPGTGKTTVAKLYGQILADIGLLSRGEVVIKTPADFIGAHVGGSEEKTSKILEATVGNILIIDEAYMLDAGDEGNTTNSFKASVLDTIVANVHGESNEDRCILLLGYEDRMNNMFKNMNPGLSRRFQSSHPWRFTNYGPSEMKKILKRRMMQEQLECTPQAFVTALDILKRASIRPDYANAAEVDQCLAVAKANYIQRLAKLPHDQHGGKDMLLPEDFDTDLEKKHESAAEEMFSTLGTDVANQLITYERTGRRAIEKGLKNPHLILPNLFAFKGSPGTGKKTAARLLARIYHNLGSLSSPEVVSRTGGDFIGRYVGQTAPKTRELLQKALSKVLLIDDANSLNHEQYGEEALREMIQFISGLSYPKTMVIILTDSTQSMNLLFKYQPSLKAHFRDEIIFADLVPDDCIRVLKRELEAQSFLVPELQLQSPLNLDMADLRHAIHRLQQIPGFQNAGDMAYVAKRVIAKSLEPGVALISDPTGQGFTLSAKLLTKSVHDIAEQRRRQFLVMVATQIPDPDRSRTMRSQDHRAMKTHHAESMAKMEASPTETVSKQQPASATAKTREKKRPTGTDSNTSRDFDEDRAEREKDVSEKVWIQLQVDKKRALNHNAKAEDKKRQEQIQRKLQSLGVCKLGFNWIEQEGGYRCAGGSHFMSHSAIRDL